MSEFDEANGFMATLKKIINPILIKFQKDKNIPSLLSGTVTSVNTTISADVRLIGDIVSITIPNKKRLLMIVGDEVIVKAIGGETMNSYIDEVRYITNPTFGFKDLLGRIHTRGTGNNNPPWSVYRGGIYQYKFTNTLKEVWIEHHIPHDYAQGTDIFIHIHWSQNIVDTGAAGSPGNIKWYFDISYADGYGTPGGAGDPFVAPKTMSVVQQASTTQYGHMIAEVIISGENDTPSTFDRTKFKVDGIILVRFYRNSNDASDTLNQAPFLHLVDCHYNTTGIPGTINKNTPFYSL